MEFIFSGKQLHPLMTRILVSDPGPEGPIVPSYNLQFNFSHFFQDVNLAIFRPSKQFILFCECSHFNRTRPGAVTGLFAVCDCGIS